MLNGDRYFSFGGYFSFGVGLSREGQVQVSFAADKKQGTGSREQTVGDEESAGSNPPGTGQIFPFWGQLSGPSLESFTVHQHARNRDI
jgi:hypothetical protein